MNALSPETAEACDLCKANIGSVHEHVLDPATRRIECACEACAILFSGAGQKYRRVPRRVRFLQEFKLTDGQWDSLAIPVGIAFFFRAGVNNKVLAIYPSPAGAVESLLPLETWREIEEQNPEVRQMESDVEGLLTYRVGAIREHYIIPLDDCFRLIGIVRLKWKGLSGGSALWKETAQFLDSLKQKSRTRQ